MKKRVISLMTSILMIIAMMASAVSLAAPTDQGDDAKTATVTLHKILQTKENLEKLKDDGKPYFPGTTGIDDTKYIGKKIEGIAGYFGEESKDIGNVYFAWKNKQGNYIDSEGNPVYVMQNDNKDLVPAGTAFDAATMENIKEDHPDFKTAVLGGETVENVGVKFTTSDLPANTYEIVEISELSTYKNPNGSTLTDSRAVPVVITLPLVNDDGVVTDAHVYPKNTEDKPEIDKNFFKDATQETIAAAIANGEITDEEAQLGANYEKYDKEKATISATIGKKVPYEVKTEIPKNAKYKTLKWTDTMSPGLSYNNDLEITIEPIDPDVGALTKDVDYTIDGRQDGFTLLFTKEGLEKIEGHAKKQALTVTLKYSATVNSNAVVDEPENNNISLDYGNTPSKENTPIEIPGVTKIPVKKAWAEGTAPTNITVTYVLYEKVKTSKEGVTPETFVWKEKEKVTPIAPYDYTFEGLDANKTYKVVEIVDGYTPEYSYKSEEGEDQGLTITNNKKPDNPEPLEPTTPKVVTYGKKFIKTNQDGTTRLAGAEFVVKNAEGKYLAMKHDAQIAKENADYNAKEQAYTEAVNNYNTAVDAGKPQSELDDLKALIEPAKRARDEALKTSNFHYYWTDKIDEAHVLISDAQGCFEIQGLAAGTYNLEEIKPPAEYAKLGKDVTFTVEKGSYKGASTEMPYNPDSTEEGYGQQVINKKVDIPQTGGMGTILFTVVGLALMTVAFIALRKRNNEQ